MAKKKLKKINIEYLAFEGGGGSGNAFPGALKALQELGIIAYDSARSTLDPSKSLSPGQSFPSVSDWKLQGQIKGFSGASAGAINSLFLSLGYSPTELEYILQTKSFDDFFDVPNPGLIPHAGGFRQDYTRPDTASFGDLLDTFNASTFGRNFNFATLYGPYVAAKGVDLQAQAVYSILSTIFVALGTSMTDLPAKALSQLSLSASNTAASFVFDWGFFPGMEIRKFFAKYISFAVERVLARGGGYPLFAKMALEPGVDRLPVRGLDVPCGCGMYFRDPQTRRRTQTSEITFAQHEIIFRNKLVVTGSNLETKQSHFFSNDTTPNMRVVDAVRISMSLPIAFKPMRIKDDADLKEIMAAGQINTTKDPHFLKGVWLDGGLLNNIPITAFDGIAGSQEKTLGLRLHPELRKEIKSVFSFLRAYPIGLGYEGTGESQVSETTTGVDRLIIIDTVDDNKQSIDLFDFKVDPTLYFNVNLKSKEKTLKFFRESVD